MNSLFIFGAKYLFVLSPLIWIVYFFKISREEKKRFLIFSFLSGVFAEILALIGRHLFFNPRPFVVGNFVPLISHAADNGFPSDHVLLLATLAGIFIIFNKKISYVLWLITFAVAVSRVYVGVHHPIDVIGSTIFALIAILITYVILRNKKSVPVGTL